jgi:intracellular multiplication protein IcmV
MGVKRVIKRGFFSGLNPLQWIGYEQIANNGRTIKNMVDNIIQPNANQEFTAAKSFEECMQHYQLTEEGLKKRMKNSLRVAQVCLTTSILMIAYWIYLFIHGLPLAAVVCIVLTLLLWAYAFREHFNYFQMKQRRLGCTFKEWFAAIFKGKQS